MKFNREILKGHLKTIFLAALEEEPSHAYALQKRVLDRSLGVFDLSEGTIYPTLHKLQDEGLVLSKWEEGEQGRKKRIYSLTEKGRRFLSESKREWNYFSQAMTLLFYKKEIQ